MQTMKRIIMVCMLAFIWAGVIYADGAAETKNAAADSKQKYSISKVKVFLDDQELTEENADDGRIKLSTIMSYTTLKTGKEFTISAMEKEITQTELRLMNSGLFYTAKVEKMTSRKNPGTYVIYITVTTGFLKRYGGGGIYAILGQAALGGNRDQLFWFAGWNRNGLCYLNENSFGLPVILGADLFTDVPAGFRKRIGPNVDGKAKLGWLITPDFRICVDVAAGFNWKELALTKELTVSPYLSETKLISQNLFYTTEVRFNYFPLQNWNHYFDTAFTVNYTPQEKLTIAVLAAGGYAPGNWGDQIKLYRDSGNLAENVGMTCKEIRSGYTTEELTVKGYLMATAELRWNAGNFMIPPCFPAHVRPYLFGDVALVEHEVNGTKPELLDAYGAGLYLVFDCPVFVTFNFSYGVNHEGKGRFCFAVMQSF